MKLLNRSDADHTSFFTSAIVTLVFSIPLVYSYFKGYYLAMLIYGIVLNLIMVLALANTRYIKEINIEHWQNFYDWVGMSKKYLKPNSQKAKHG